MCGMAKKKIRLKKSAEKMGWSARRVNCGNGLKGEKLSVASSLKRQEQAALGLGEDSGMEFITEKANIPCEHQVGCTGDKG